MKKFIALSVFATLFTMPSFAAPTELDKKTVASKAYVDTKQDKITTGLVEFNGNPEFMLPAITTYDSISGLVSNKIGILDYETILDDEGGWSSTVCLVTTVPKWTTLFQPFVPWQKD